MKRRMKVASGVCGSHFATMRESMPEIQTSAEDDEKPIEAPEFSTISEWLCEPIDDLYLLSWGRGERID